MKLTNYIIPSNSDLSSPEARRDLKNLYDSFGILYFPRLLENDSLFETMGRELCELLSALIVSSTGGTSDHSSLDHFVELENLVRLASSSTPSAARAIANLGTQPNSLTSFNRLKHSAVVMDLVSLVFNNDAILGSPDAGDTLHFFPPGSQFHRYNLPPHQDFPFLMQSESQVTCYLGMSPYHDGVGGLGVWLGSHKDGLRNTDKDKNGAWKISAPDAILESYDYVEIAWNPGDFAIFDSLLLHRSVPNTTEDHARIVQIFRFSDLTDPSAISLEYRSKTYARQSVDFEDYYQGFLR